MKHVALTDSMGYARHRVSSGRGAETHQRELRPAEVTRPKGKATEMIIWAVLFILIILATIALIVLVLMEEPARAHAALSNPSWIASSPVPFFS